LAKILLRFRELVFNEGKQYTTLNTADEAILHDYFYTDVTEKPKSTPTKKESETSQPTGDGNSKHQIEKPLDDESSLKQKKNARELAGHEMLLGDGCKLPAKDSY
jgi:hypothetical protein